MDSTNSVHNGIYGFPVHCIIVQYLIHSEIGSVSMERIKDKAIGLSVLRIGFAFSKTVVTLCWRRHTSTENKSSSNGPLDKQTALIVLLPDYSTLNEFRILSDARCSDDVYPPPVDKQECSMH